MGVWERSKLTLSGSEYEVQEALLALQRLLKGGAVRPTTRVILEGAALALRNELAFAEERAYSCERSAAPK